METKPVVIVRGAWPGQEFFEVTHLNGHAIIHYHTRHPFFERVYLLLAELALQEPADLDPAEAPTCSVRSRTPWTMCSWAYAKAENLHDQPDLLFSNLRTVWGQSLRTYVESD